MRRPARGRWRVGLALGGALLICLARAPASGQPEELPGADAIFAGRGVAILWGVLRGPDEARTRVVLRIERLDPAAPWRLASVEAIDPFTKEREWVRLAIDLTAEPAETVEMPREGFLAKPSRRVLFYPDVPALQAGRPGLVVSYVSVPDTAPEFASRAALEEHLRRVRERLRRP